ncbi:MAG: hypothetical protein WC814_01120 [Candidatus Paceibacterota bacterium]|jgi:hypothetical protein
MVYTEGRLKKFDHHYIITLPNGKRIQVPHRDVREKGNGELVLAADATIEEELETVVSAKPVTVLIPQQVVDRLK